MCFCACARHNRRLERGIRRDEAFMKLARCCSPSCCRRCCICLSLSGAAHAQGAPSAAPTGDPAQSAPLAAPTANVDVSAERRARGAAGRRHLGRVALHARRSDREGGDRASAAGLAVVVDDHHQQMDRARRAASARPTKFEKDVLVRAARSTIFISNSRPSTDHPMAAVFISALREWRRAFEGGAPRESLLAGIKERIDKAMSVTITARDRRHRAPAGVSGHRRRHGALHRPVRHGVGHHEFVLRHRRAP